MKTVSTTARLGPRSWKRRATSTSMVAPTRKDSILAAIEKTKLDTIVGPIDFTGEVMPPGPAELLGYTPGPGRKHKNLYDHGLGEAQWLMLGGKWTFEQVPVSNAAAPYMAADTLQAPKP